MLPASCVLRLFPPLRATPPRVLQATYNTSFGAAERTVAKRYRRYHCRRLHPSRRRRRCCRCHAAVAAAAAAAAILSAAHAGDLYSLAAVTAVAEMQGPEIPWSWGRVDNASCATQSATALIPDAMGDAFNQNADGSYAVTPDRAPPAAGALAASVPFCLASRRRPAGGFNISGLRAKFARMGLNDSDTVALSGAHTVGFGHRNATGFVGAWVTRPVRLSLSRESII